MPLREIGLYLRISDATAGGPIHDAPHLGEIGEGNVGFAAAANHLGNVRITHVLI